MSTAIYSKKLHTHYFYPERDINSSGPGVSGLILYPNGEYKWLNAQPYQVTNVLMFDGPIVTKLRELVVKQDKVIILPFGDEECFYLQPWWSIATDNIPNNDRTWVRPEPIIDTKKYETYKEIFGNNFIVLTVCLYKGIASYPEVRLIPWSDEIYKFGPYKNMLARDILPEIKYKDKLDKVVWRGGGFTHHINCGQPRVKIENILKNYSWANGAHNDGGWNGGGNMFLSNKEQSQYKVIIIVDGSSYPSSVDWCWLTNSVIINISNWITCAVINMTPWKDYIPVKMDLSDLVENIEWVFNNPEEAEKIALQGKETYIKYTSREELDKVLRGISPLNPLSG